MCHRSRILWYPETTYSPKSVAVAFLLELMNKTSDKPASTIGESVNCFLTEFSERLFNSRQDPSLWCCTDTKELSLSLSLDGPSLSQFSKVILQISRKDTQENKALAFSEDLQSCPPHSLRKWPPPSWVTGILFWISNLPRRFLWHTAGSFMELLENLNGQLWSTKWPTCGQANTLSWVWHKSVLLSHNYQLWRHHVFTVNFDQNDKISEL